jgi:hypothetical protein
MILLLSFFSCNHTKKLAIKYNDAIIVEQRKVVNKENDLTAAIKQNTNNLDSILTGLIKQVEESTAIISKLEVFENNNEFKVGALKLFEVYNSVATNEYKAWLLNLKTPLELVDDKVLDEEKELISSINGNLPRYSLIMQQNINLSI